MKKEVNPEIIYDLTQLTKRLTVVWAATPPPLKRKITLELKSLGVQRIGKTWAIQLNGRMIPLN